MKARHRSQRRAGVSGRYLEAQDPRAPVSGSRFMTEDGAWMDEAICLRRRFERLQPRQLYLLGVRLRTPVDPLHRRPRGYFEHVDGGGEGEVHRYRLAALPMPDDAD